MVARRYYLTASWLAHAVPLLTADRIAKDNARPKPDDKMADEENTPKSDLVEVQINFRVPGRMPGVYAQHLFIQPGSDEVVLSFFEIIPPLVAPGKSEDENLKQLRETGVVAECVARVIVPHARF